MLAQKPAGSAATQPAAAAVFGRLNGEVINQEEYVRMLERQQVNGGTSGGQPVNATRFVLDQLIGNKVILAEAGREGTLPSPEALDRYYATQKALFEHQFPGKSYETTLTEQGTAVSDIKNDLRVQLAETNLYVKRLGITQAEVRDLYDRARDQIGIPERVQLRFVAAPVDSAEFKRAQDLIDRKIDFTEVARQINPPQLKANAGLVGQLTPLPNIVPQYREQVRSGSEGTIFGPVDFQQAANGQPALKAWLKIEKKVPGLRLSYEEAAAIVCRQLVQQRLGQPQYARFRRELIDMKLKANFTPTDPRYAAVWEALRRDAQAALASIPSAPAGAAAPK